MNGLVNHHASCFMDVILVALFVPRYNAVFIKLFFDSPELLQQPDGGETAWERAPACTAQWRQQVRDTLLKLVQDMHANTAGALTVATLQRLFKQVPAGDLNYGQHEHQSAVDFLRYLLNVFRVRDSLVSFQTSTTSFTARPEVAAAGVNVAELVRVWVAHPVASKHTRRSNACQDAADRAYLERDATDQAAILINTAGDVRRIGHVEDASVFLCALTPQDHLYTRVDRNLQPYADQLSGQDGYTGTVATKLVATRLLHAPVLIIEVSRKWAALTGQGYTEQKLQMPVYYADTHDMLHIHGQTFRLCAVVCHLGSANDLNGHYVAYVHDGQQWLFYDDVAPLGRMLPVSTLEPHASTNGELFFYTRCTQ